MAQGKLLALYNKDSDSVRVSLWTDADLNSGVVELWHGDAIIHTCNINPKTKNLDDNIYSIMFNKPSRNIELLAKAILDVSGTPVTTTAYVTTDDNAGELYEVPNDITSIPITRTEPLVEMVEENQHTDSNTVLRKKDHVHANRPSEPVVDAVGDQLLLLVAFGEKWPLKRGNGAINYVGGGNRLYWDDKGALQIQAQNTTPVGFAFSEQSTNNLLDNVWLSLTQNAPNGWYIEYDDSVGVASSLVNEIHPILKQWNIQLTKTANVWSDKAKFTSNPIAITNASVSFSTLLNIRNELDNLKVVFTWLVGNTIIHEDAVTFDPTRFENRWGMMAHTLMPAAGATHLSVVIVATPLIGQTPLMKLLSPNIVQASQPTSLIVGASNRIQDAWRVPTAQNNINPDGSSVEIAAILGGSSAGTIFDCRDGFGVGVAALWTGVNLSFIINAGAGDEVLDVPWTPVSNVTWKFIWRDRYRAIVVNNSMLLENTDAIELPASVGTSLLVAQNLNCQLISLKIERSTPI